MATSYTTSSWNSGTTPKGTTPFGTTIQPTYTGATLPVAGNPDVRGQLVTLISDTTSAYNQLMAQGKENDAFALREALTNMQRSGTSRFARMGAISALKTSMANAARTLQGTLTGQALARHQNILGDISNIDATTFNQGMQLAQNSQQQGQQAFSNSMRVKEFDAANGSGAGASFQAGPQPTQPTGPTPAVSGGAFRTSTKAAVQPYDLWAPAQAPNPWNSKRYSYSGV